MEPKLDVTEPQTHILAIEKDGNDGLIVTFSDGTTAGYIAEELLSLRPYREPYYGLRKPVTSTAIATRSQMMSPANSA